ncbi:MAG TPA: PQQ-binding-like beta-propeller repeat protein [Verrucomicrobiae bacterium]|nr:PQQ-binding-like beta-propeller repeat protein [Verrucomicrobiae bacterium]
MRIVVDCTCQTSYEFEIEPADGRMPGSVYCPNCGADGTEYANWVIQETLAIRGQAAPAIQLKRSAGEESEPEPEPAAGAAEDAAGDEGGLPKFCYFHKDQPVEAFCLQCKKPICLKCMKQTGYFCSIYCRNRAQESGMDIPIYAGQERVAREREYKLVSQVGTAIVIGLVALFIGYEWYQVFGQKPSVKFSMPMPAGDRLAHAQFVNDREVLLVSANSVSDFDLGKKQPVWTTSLAAYRAKSPPNPAAAAAAAEDDAEPKPAEGETAQQAAKKQRAEQLAEYYEDYYSSRDAELHVVGNDVWVTVGRNVVCLDRATGKEKVKLQTEGRVREMSFGGDGMVVVSGKSDYDQVLTRVQLPSGTQQSERRTFPAPPPRHIDYEANPGAAMDPYIPDEQREFVAAGSTVADLDVKAVEKKVVSVETMKRADPNSDKFNNLGVTQTKEFAEDVMNELSRTRGGGSRRVDQSRYNVTIQRVFGKDTAPWTGEVVGPPAFFAMKTVDVLAAGTTMYVFDRGNQKLWQSTLSYPISPRFVRQASAWGYGYGERSSSAAPCVERGDTLYFFDQGVLAAFNTRSGAARWRLPSVGISGIQFDDRGMLYVITTTASPESIQYSDQVSLDRVEPVIVKVDPATGKMLWRLEKIGDECHVAGKFLYSTRTRGPSPLMTINAKGPLTGTFHLVRLNPRNGKQLWDYTRAGSPSAVDFCNNSILFQYDDKLEVLRFLAL